VDQPAFAARSMGFDDENGVLMPTRIGRNTERLILKEMLCFGIDAVTALLGI
jgi:hypothetical protein